MALTSREFDLLAYLAVNRGPGAVAAPAARRRVGRRLVRRRAHRRRPRPAAAQEARRRPAPHHRVGRRLPARLRPGPCAAASPSPSSGVVIGTLVLTVVGSLLLVRRAAISTAENELTHRGPGHRRAHVAVPGVHRAPRWWTSLRRVGAFDQLDPGGPEPRRARSRPCPPPSAASLLERGRAAVGRRPWRQRGPRRVRGPTAGPDRRANAPRSTTGCRRRTCPSCVVTRHVADPVNGVDYFVLVAGVVLLAGVVVAAVLGPAHQRAASCGRSTATRQIAGGRPGRHASR